MPRAERLLGWLAGVLLLAVPAGAQGSIETFGDQEFGVTSLVPLPRAMRSGWVPVQLTLHNRKAAGPVERGLTLGGDWGSPFAAELDVRLEPGERRTVEVVVPFLALSGAEAVRCLVRDSAGKVTANRIVHRIDSASANSSALPVLVVTEAPYDLVSSFAADSRSFGGRKLVAGGLEVERLSTDWRAYSTLGAVVVDLDTSLPESAQIDALLQWVGLGGVLSFVGGDPRLARSLLERSGVTLSEAGRIAAEPRRNEIHRLGFGRVLVPRVDAPESMSGVRLAERALPTHGWTIGAAEDDPAQMSGVFSETFLRRSLPLPGVGLPPIGILTGLLIVFTLVLGPLQFWQLKRSKAKPHRFLQTTPLIGGVFVLGVVLVSLLSQGLDVRESVASVTWLDQRRATASTIATRTSFSGSPLARALRYDAGVLQLPTYFHPQRDGVPDASFRVDLNDGHALTGRFLPVRVPASSVLVATQSARAGLTLEREGATLRAVNGLDVTLAGLVVRDADGDFWQTVEASDLPPGARVELVRTDRIPEVTLRRPVDARPLEILEGLSPEAPRDSLDRNLAHHLPPLIPPRAWMAEADTNPFLPDGGVARHQEHASHLLIGVLEDGR